MSNLTAIVLAGGKSRRMGQDKALIPLNGVPLLQQVSRLAASVTPCVCVVSDNPEKYSTLLPPEGQFIRDTISKGPLWGFVQGLEYVTTGWVLLLACDLPGLSQKQLQDWVDGLEKVEEGAIATLPYYQEKWHPLTGFYRTCCKPSLLEFLQQGGSSFQQWLAQHFVQPLPFSDHKVLFNCNTPQDLVTWRNQKAANS